MLLLVGEAAPVIAVIGLVFGLAGYTLDALYLGREPGSLRDRREAGTLALVAAFCTVYALAGTIDATAWEASWAAPLSFAAAWPLLPLVTAPTCGYFLAMALNERARSI